MPIVGLVLFLGAWVGHTALLCFSLNWWYGVPLPRRLHTALRLLHGLLVLAFPVGLGLTYGFDLPEGLTATWSEPLRTASTAYLVLCWAVGFGVLPLITLVRLLRRPPAALVAEHARTVDVAAELGYKPLGHGKHRPVAALPYNQVFQVEFSERTFQLPQLPPAWDGLTILHVSDVHFIGTPDREFYQHVFDRCAAWEPDLVALTGDIVDSKRHHRWIVPLLGRLRWRVAAFAILGNHDYWYDPTYTRRRLRRLGFRVLDNTWEKVEVRGEPLVVIGHEGPWFKPPPDLSDCPEGVFRLCLSHTPDNLRWARQHRIDLVLAGHNHGGQVRFPLIGSVLVPSRYSRRYDCGTFSEPPTLLHVSRGLAGQHPLRYNCRPEVTRITLKAGGV